MVWQKGDAGLPEHAKQEPIVYSMHEVDNVFSDTLHGDSFEEYPEYISLQASSFVF